MSARIERGGEGSKLWINKKTKNNVRYYYFFFMQSLGRNQRPNSYGSHLKMSK